MFGQDWSIFAEIRKKIKIFKIYQILHFMAKHDLIWHNLHKKLVK